MVFTFSKKKCEENAATLVNADLCASVEKSEIHVAIEKALSRLKGKLLLRSTCGSDLWVVKPRIGRYLKFRGCVIYYREV